MTNVTQDPPRFKIIDCHLPTTLIDFKYLHDYHRSDEEGSLSEKEQIKQLGVLCAKCRCNLIYQYSVDATHDQFMCNGICKRQYFWHEICKMPRNRLNLIFITIPCDPTEFGKIPVKLQYTKAMDGKSHMVSVPMTIKEEIEYNKKWLVNKRVELAKNKLYQ